MVIAVLMNSFQEVTEEQFQPMEFCMRINNDPYTTFSAPAHPESRLRDLLSFPMQLRWELRLLAARFARGRGRSGYRDKS
eukprot:gene16757-12720_t